jgi:hypothetical protein
MKKQCGEYNKKICSKSFASKNPYAETKEWFLRIPEKILTVTRFANRIKVRKTVKRKVNPV